MPLKRIKQKRQLDENSCNLLRLILTVLTCVLKTHGHNNYKQVLKSNFLIYIYI